MRYLDAHNHLHDARLQPHRGEILTALHELSIERAVVNGTREADWDAVTALAREESFVIPSYGVHPWYVAGVSRDWLDRLRVLLEADPSAAIGEIGLDRWVQNHDVARQGEVFRAQLELAARLKRPATIHCLRAWGMLFEVLSEYDLPRGFLLHAYGGPAEMVPGFVKRGAYFSFSTYFLHERKSTQREVFRQIPMERLLVETDAPDLWPPDDRNSRPLRTEREEPMNHPANIDLSYAELARLRGQSVEELAGVVRENFGRLFTA